MKLTDDQLALLPSDDDVRQYHERGWYISQKLFSDEEIDAAVAGTDLYYTGRVIETPGAPLPPYLYPKNDYHGLRKSDYASFLCPELAAISRHPLLGAIAARLTGSPTIRLWHDQLLYKPVDDPDLPANVGWHTDRGYWKTCTSPNMLTAWIPFHDCGAKEGSITMVDGSNHWPDNSEALNFFSNDLEGLESKFVTGGKPVVKVPMNLAKGHASFHNCLTIHGSGPNRSSQPRRSVAVHMQDESNRFQVYTHSNGAVAEHPNDWMIRKDADGHPDYFDPNYCPQLWP